MPDTAADGKPWPRISIVTPSFKQGQFIEETIRSVLLQGYPNLEYIVIDGGSTDSSVEIIRKYEPWLTYWVSECDRGQSHAINKGFKRATGEILGYINSDDYYSSGAFQSAAEALAHSTLAWCCGSAYELNENSGIRVVTKCRIPHSWAELISHYSLTPQPSTFWRSSLWQTYGPFEESMFFSFDWDLFCRFLQGGHVPLRVPAILSTFRRHSSAKTTTHLDVMLRDDARIWRKCLSRAGFKQKLAGLSYYLATPQGGHIADVVRLVMSHVVYPPSLLFPFHRSRWTAKADSVAKCIRKVASRSSR